MISQSNNRVLAIKSKFESLSTESEQLKPKTSNVSSIVQLNKQKILNSTLPEPEKQTQNDCMQASNDFKYIYPIKDNNKPQNKEKIPLKFDTNISSDECTPIMNNSYLYAKLEAKKGICDIKKQTLSRQTSDPGKKLHRSHAFRCDKSQKISNSPKRHGSCNSRSETTDYMLKVNEKPKLSKEKLKKLGNLLEDKMRRENFVASHSKIDLIRDLNEENSPDSIPDEEVPQHILDQYAKVIKSTKKQESPDAKHDPMTDSGVSSETENLEEITEKSSRIKRIKAQFETVIKTDELKIHELKLRNKTNLELMNEGELCSSSETMRLERKNPHVDLTDTLKKALKQPLPAGPPPKKPPRIFEEKRKDPKVMLEKLERVLQKRQTKPNNSNIYDIVETDSTPNRKQKEMHYLCTEILDITHRTMLPNSSNVTDTFSNCFNSLNCTTVTNQSTASLPYTRLSTGSNICCACTENHVENQPSKPRFSTFFAAKPDNALCGKCNNNFNRSFKCHLNCKCEVQKSEFFLRKDDHIYDEPNLEQKSGAIDNFSVGDASSNSVMQESGYGVLKTLKRNGFSKSLEDLRFGNEETVVEKIYDIPCDVSRSPSPDVTPGPKSFEVLRQGFESGFRNTDSAPKPNPSPKSDSKRNPPIKPKPDFVKLPSGPRIKTFRSTENLSGDTRAAKHTLKMKFATEARPKRFQKNGNRGCLANGLLSVPKRDRKDQIDVDRENLNRLMNEIYETVSAACRMDDRQRPSKFPTEQSDGTSSEDSVKLTRSLTEKRKNYVRRVSSRAAYMDPNNVKKHRYRHQTSICSYKSENLTENPYSTFRSWKSFRTSQNNLSKSQNDDSRRDSIDSKINLTDSKGNLLSMKGDFEDLSLDNLSLDDKAGCLDIDLHFEPKFKALFDVCLLVGLNYMTGKAYVKSVFPSQVTVPPHIENLVFPETLNLDESSAKQEYELNPTRMQSYSLVLTNEKGERNFGYCRRVLPEGASSCLPLCYCIIGRYRAPGFYYKVLQEIESHHGSSEVEIHTILQQLLETEFPNSGEEIHIEYRKRCELNKNPYRNSVNLGDILKSKTLPEKKSESSELLLSHTDTVPEFYDIENNNGPKRVFLNVEGKKFKVLKRPIEPRIDEDNLSVLLDSLGAGLVIKVFGSLLLERKVVLISDNLSQLSFCMEALQTILYPFVWQQPLISTIPSELKKDILEAPLPILAGLLRRPGCSADTWERNMEGILFEEGMLIDLTNSPPKLIFYQGDESTILPSVCYKTLKATLQMESSKSAQGGEDVEKTRNVMISEAFLRFFVDIMDDFWDHFAVGVLKETDMGKDNVIFEKESFVKNSSTKQTQYFLEWFTETAMFNHFIENMAVSYLKRKQMAPQPIDYSTVVGVVDAPLPNFYELFDERVTRKRKCAAKTLKGADRCENPTKNNYKNAINKRMRLLKSKLRELVN